VPSYDNGERFGGAAVTNIMLLNHNFWGTSCEYKEDWAILIIDQRLGDTVGYMGLATNPNPIFYDRPYLYNLGYPGDKDGGNRPYFQTSITARSTSAYRCDANGPVDTDTDAASGQSGSPLWENNAEGQRWIWGVLSVTGSTLTLAASGENMISAIINSRNLYP
jgi:V8-like Glu-specific endopeptidase